MGTELDKVMSAAADFDTANVVNDSVVVDINVVDAAVRIVDNSLQFSQIAHSSSRRRIHQAYHGLKIEILGVHDIALLGVAGTVVSQNQHEHHHGWNHHPSKHTRNRHSIPPFGMKERYCLLLSFGIFAHRR